MVYKNHRGVQRSIAAQAHAIKRKYADFNVIYDFKALKVEGHLQPTARSSIYRFVLKYALCERPKVKIISPALEKNGTGENIPHLYPDATLCLYHPRFFEFLESDLFCDTIIPWTNLWLYYYEMWHITKKWLGGGIHPPNANPRKNEKKR